MASQKIVSRSSSTERPAENQNMMRLDNHSNGTCEIAEDKVIVEEEFDEEWERKHSRLGCLMDADGNCISPIRNNGIHTTYPLFFGDVRRFLTRGMRRRKDGFRETVRAGAGSPFYEPKWPLFHTSKVLCKEVLVLMLRRQMGNSDQINETFIQNQVEKEKSSLSDDTIGRRLWTKTFDATTDDVMEPCGICSVGYTDKDEIAMLYYCKHEYHVDCIKKSLVVENLCPVCKTLALISNGYPDWKGTDIQFHQMFFQVVIERNFQFVLSSDSYWLNEYPYPTY